MTNEQFRMLSDGYNTEQRDIQEQTPKLQAEIQELKAAATNVDKFVDIAYKYTDLQELTPEVLRTFIAKVVIHERSDKWSKSAEQQIDIYFRYIGNLTVQPVEQAGWKERTGSRNCPSYSQDTALRWNILMRNSVKDVLFASKSSNTGLKRVNDFMM